MVVTEDTVMYRSKGRAIAMDIPAIEESIQSYLKLNKIEKIQHIKKRLGTKRKEFVFSSYNDIPILIHKKYNLEFVYIPGGRYIKGFTEENQTAAEKISRIVNANYEEMRPVSMEMVGSFLITRTPVLNNFINSDCSENRNNPLYCSFEDANEIARQIKMRLPSESEWEYFVRAGKETLFPFGDELLQENELEKWMELDFEDLSKLKSNDLGVYGLFVGEWTSDYFRTNYSSDADVLKSRSIRGGGAFFWPWQDQEWVWCMSAMRMPSDDLIDDCCAFRIVFDI